MAPRGSNVAQIFPLNGRRSAPATPRNVNVMNVPEVVVAPGPQQPANQPTQASPALKSLYGIPMQPGMQG
ncbi:hypothetical protein FRC08_000982 [Ceratobasidium sp. 394]|nr:hypothetical protein FRC08_000982 [Ceratobasidium sp. 394]